MRPIITSRKHMHQLGINSVMGGTLSVITFLDAKQDANHATSQDVDIGSNVKAVYVEIWLLAGSQQPGSITVTIEKRVSGSPAMTFTNSATLHTYNNKNNLFYTTQGLTPDANGNPIPFLRQWIKIPKGKQRMSLGDKLVLNLSANVEDCTFCGLMIYKDYT